MPRLNPPRFQEFALVVAATPDELPAIHEALDKLTVEDSPAAELVKLRYFVGIQRRKHDGFGMLESCCATEMLRVELQDGCSFLFLNQHLLFRELQSGDVGDVLRLSLATHEVRIMGNNLRELLLALQATESSLTTGL